MIYAPLSLYSFRGYSTVRPNGFINGGALQIDLPIPSYSAVLSITIDVPPVSGFQRIRASTLKFLLQVLRNSPDYVAFRQCPEAPAMLPPALSLSTIANYCLGASTYRSLPDFGFTLTTAKSQSADQPVNSRIRRRTSLLPFPRTPEHLPE